MEMFLGKYYVFKINVNIETFQPLIYSMHKRHIHIHLAHLSPLLLLAKDSYIIIPSSTKTIIPTKLCQTRILRMALASYLYLLVFRFEIYRNNRPNNNRSFLSNSCKTYLTEFDFIERNRTIINFRVLSYRLYVFLYRLKEKIGPSGVPFLS